MQAVDDAQLRFRSIRPEVEEVDGLCPRLATRSLVSHGFGNENDALQKRERRSFEKEIQSL
jgi:hypothetical protein